MTSQTSLYLRQYVQEHVLMAADHPSPTSLYLALFTSDPKPNGSGIEVSAGGYARRPVSWQFLAGRVDASGNDTQLTFNEATTDWGLVTHWGVFDALTDGNLLYFGSATLARSAVTGVQYFVPENNVVIDSSGDVVS